MEYTCKSCGMGVKDLKCAKCNSELVADTVEKDGKKIQVSKCPNDCGMIKSPTCCGHDMMANG